MLRINWISNHYTYYNAYLFDSIGTRLHCDLFIYYRTVVLDSHPWKDDVYLTKNSRIIKGLFFGIDTELLKRVFMSKDFFIISGWNNFLYFYIITILSFRNVPFAIYTDTPRRQQKSIKQFLKGIWLKYIFRKDGKATLLATGSIGVQRALESFPILRQRVLNFPFATNTEFFKPLGSSKNFEDEIIFLSVGRIDFGHKGQNVAIKALSILTGRVQKRFKYLIAGTGDDSEALKVMIQDLNLNEQVTMLGWVEIDALPELYNRAHFTIHSSFEDPFPNSILESLSCGIPVIASDSAGSAIDRIENGVNGFIHPVGDSESLAEILHHVFTISGDEYSKMSEMARQKSLNWKVDYHLSVIEGLFHTCDLVQEDK